MDAIWSETAEFVFLCTHVVGPQHREHHSDGRGVLRLAASDRHVPETRCQSEHGLRAGRAYLGSMQIVQQRGERSSANTEDSTLPWLGARRFTHMPENLWLFLTRLLTNHTAKLPRKNRAALRSLISRHNEVSRHKWGSLLNVHWIQIAWMCAHFVCCRCQADTNVLDHDGRSAFFLAAAQAHGRSW